LPPHPEQNLPPGTSFVPHPGQKFIGIEACFAGIDKFCADHSMSNLDKGVSSFGDLTEEQKLLHEEMRIQRHQSAAKDKWNNPVPATKIPPRNSPREVAPAPGRRVVLYWLDRQSGHRVIEPMSTTLDVHGRLPLSFIQAEWNCKNLQLKDGPILKLADNGYSLQAMPPSENHLEFYADDLSRAKRTATPHVEVEITTDLPAGRLPGMGLTQNTYIVEQNLSMPAKQASMPINFCPGCGTKLVPGGRFCSGCGGKVF